MHIAQSGYVTSYEGLLKMRCKSLILPSFFVAAMDFLFHLLFWSGREGRGVGGEVYVGLPVIFTTDGICFFTVVSCIKI
jgi:hypothetical protein